MQRGILFLPLTLLVTSLACAGMPVLESESLPTEYAIPSLSPSETLPRPATLPPSWTPEGGESPSVPVSGSCQQDTQAYIQQVEPLISQFADTAAIADSTARIALGPVIQDMQSIRRAIEDIPSPSCALTARNLLVSGIQNSINGYIDFMGDAGDATVSREFAQAAIETENAVNQLIALASDEATPIPLELPTSTSIPTLLPTATALPHGSPIIIGNWQIQVQRVEVTDSLSFDLTGTVELAAGRFALVFLSVTNVGLSQDTFVPFGTLEVQDAEGRRYQDNFLASSMAQSSYETDIGAYINPNETANVVVVYDISTDSAYYQLVPGSLADTYSASVLIEIP